MFSKKELKYFLIVVFCLTLFFGFDDGSEVFNAVRWITHLVKVFFMVFISYGLYIWFQRQVAYKHGAKSKFSLWYVRQLWIVKRKKKINTPRIFIGIILGFIFMLFSYGKIAFTALATQTFKEIPSLRTGRKYKKISDYESALIYFSGPLISIILILIFGWLKQIGFETTMLININLFICIWNLVPLPGIDGNKILFSSRMVYVFGVIALILAYVLSFLGIISAILISLIVAGIIAGIYHYKWES